MSKHTPGPWMLRSWKAAHGGNEPKYWIAHRGFVHDRLYMEGKVYELRTGQNKLLAIPMTEANARLIAAAPELLEALQAYDAWSAKVLPNDEDLRALREKIRAAIAKATRSQS